MLQNGGYPMGEKYLDKHFRNRRLNKNRMARFGAFDIETEGLNAKAFKCGVLLDGRDYKIFYNAKEMFTAMCTREYRNYKWYGHNVEYDLSGFVDNVITDLDDVIFSGSRLIMAKKHYDENNTITFLDSFNLFNCSLKKVGEIIGLQKLDVDFNKTGLNSLVEYCKRDVEITFKAVEFFNNVIFDNYRVNIGVTVGATALKVFQSNFHKDIWFKLPKFINDQFRNAYYGGRCEVFIKGRVDKPIYHYDINSLYPYAMTKCRFPHPNAIKTRAASVLDMDIINEFEGCADVLIESPGEMHIPFLPHRLESKLLFPTGEFKGTYNFNELRYAMKSGYEIKDIYKIAYSKFPFNPFEKYVNEIYQRRLKFQSEKNNMEYIFKYLLNSLYGKFGEKHEDVIYGYEHEKAKYQYGSFYPLTELKDKSAFGYFSDGNETYTNHTFYNICSYVTSTARCILYDYFKKWKPSDIIYCDTDSVFALSPYNNAVGSELGGLKLEGIYDYGIFLKPKMYHVHNDKTDYTKIKGIPSKVADISKTRFEFDRVVKSKESLRRKLTAGMSMKVIKQITFDDEKRIADRRVDFYKNCCSTTPIEIHHNA